MKSGPKKTSDPLDTPVMRQYLELKQKAADAILFFRMGDFYEMFLEDAIEAAPIMDVALTKRQNDIPMAGVPFHSSFIYLTRLLDAGKKVAIAEQKIDPDNPKLMAREIVRVITPGTLIEEGLLEGADQNLLCALVMGEAGIGVGMADVSTGDFFCYEMELDQIINTPDPDLLHHDEKALFYGSMEKPLRNLASRYAPREYLVSSDWKKIFSQNFEHPDLITYMEPWKSSATEGQRRLQARFGKDRRGLGFDEGDGLILAACSMILHYTAEVFPAQITTLRPPRVLKNIHETMVFDEQTISNMDLIVSREEGSRARSLYGVMNACKTSSGKRALREAILSPLRNKTQIEQRQNHIKYFVENYHTLEKIRECLEDVFDIERILVRMSAQKFKPADLGAIRHSIQAAMRIQELLIQTKSPDVETLARLDDKLLKLYQMLADTYCHELPVKAGDAPIVKDKIDAQLDQSRRARDNGGSLLQDFESSEKEKNKMVTLKVKFNKLAGYFIEVSRQQAPNAPAHWNLRQSLTSVARFTCPELEELQNTLLQAEQVIARIEDEYLNKGVAQILDHIEQLNQMSDSLAHLDLICNLAFLARKKNWVCPQIHDKRVLDIVEGRHPVVENFLATGEDFISNGAFLNSSDRQFAILTGPNMAGKSTYIRQIALLQLMAQMGSWVPAARFACAIVDRIFTRIGAHDNLTRGESTFYVEMLEASRILNQCTNDSLVIMDEVGRGTSTFDGISLAHAIVEYLNGEGGVRPFCFFATHYHELTSLESREGIFNLTVDVREVNSKVLFLHKVKEGAADKSYGIHVARLAGMPDWVITRAEQRLQELERQADAMQNNKHLKDGPKLQTLYSQKATGSKDKKTSPESALSQPGLFDQ